MLTETAACLADIPLFAGLPEPLRAELWRAGGVRVLRRGETLFHQDDPATALPLVLSGWIKVWRATAAGGETVLHMIHAGETFAEPAVFGLGHYPAAATATTDARVFLAPAALTARVMTETPAHAQAVIAALSMRARRLVEDRERLATGSTVQRVARFLVDLIAAEGGDGGGGGPITAPLPYDKTLIAGRLGMTPESLSRALAKLRAAGLNVDGDTVTIGNPDALATLAEGA